MSSSPSRSFATARTASTTTLARSSRDVDTNLLDIAVFATSIRIFLKEASAGSTFSDTSPMTSSVLAAAFLYPLIIVVG